MGVLAYRRRQALAPLPVGEAHAYWRLPVQGVVGMMMMMAGEAGVVAVPPVDARDDDAHDDDPPPCLGHPPIPPNKPPLEVLGALAEPLEP